MRIAAGAIPELSGPPEYKRITFRSSRGAEKEPDYIRMLKALNRIVIPAYTDLLMCNTCHFWTPPKHVFDTRKSSTGSEAARMCGHYPELYVVWKWFSSSHPKRQPPR